MLPICRDYRGVLARITFHGEGFGDVIAMELEKYPFILVNIKKCSKLEVINDNLISCSKKWNCECPYHPNCSGKDVKCIQKLEINGVFDSYLGFREFSYYTGIDSRVAE